MPWIHNIVVKAVGRIIDHKYTIIQICSVKYYKYSTGFYEKMLRLTSF